jgi:hypothetical protein
MLRALVVACALILCGSSEAGCGGLSLQRVARQDSKDLLGDPHPRVMRIETVRIVNGTREAVITLQGHFKIRTECLPLASSQKQCHPFSHPRYAVLDFSLPNPKDSQGFWIPAHAQLTAITRARGARPLFSIFPDFMNFTVRCDIPRGGSSSGTIAGTCSTDTDSSNHAMRVRFIERWPRASRRDGSWPAYEKSGGWIVTLERSGRVRSIRVTGHLPPQLTN